MTQSLLKDKVSIISGAGRGLGKQIALAYAKEGAKIAICSRTESELRETAREVQGLGSSVISSTIDVSNESQIEHFVKTVLDTFGTVDVLVNNAGIIGPISPVVEANSSEWLQTVMTNLMGTMYFSKHVIKIMIPKNDGRIINVSGSGVGGFPNFSAYACSKSAITRLTETLAEEVKRYNICVNAIAPGGIRTKMTDDIASVGSQAGESEGLRVRKVIEEGGVPLDLPAELAVFLASHASEGLTGKLISAVHDDWLNWSGKGQMLTNSQYYTMRRLDSHLLRNVKE